MSRQSASAPLAAGRWREQHLIICLRIWFLLLSLSLPFSSVFFFVFQSAHSVAFGGPSVLRG
jgi:hypothetical protein